ncbi:MAG TPA: glycoside hydrolase family 27 protein [Terriglobales bacterium]|nr:glycoside hydrolase family 27 protein [Terriglobales bacterium]
MKSFKSRSRIMVTGVSPILFLCLWLGTAQAQGRAGTQPLAATPPMGWNSWDSFGTTVKEEDVKANADWLARKLKRYGWEYVVVDMEWFVTNPRASGNSTSSQFSMDGDGRYIPAENRFPSSANGAGFKPLADHIHSLGLKFGIHILRGIPKQAVNQNLPIAGSVYHAVDAADITDTCPWNPDNYGLDPTKPASQAYYDSIAKLYASWGVDFVKVDCIASRPYKGEDIRMLSDALKKTGRPIVLSLSPGAAPMDKVDEMRKYAQMWRISDDVWDLWHSTVSYPQGLGDQFPRMAQWAGLSEEGHWPDADMLPLGYLGPAPGWGDARQTRFTHDEQRTMVTLWSMFRSPLMVGANLPRNDDWTTSLLTNPEVIAIDQYSIANRMMKSEGHIVVWSARPASGTDQYVALFNTAESAQTAHLSWEELGLTGKKYKMRDLWSHKNLGAAGEIAVTIPVHGCVLYRITER